MSQSKKVVWTQTVLRDLDRIIAFIYNDRPLVAKRLLKEIKTASQTLHKNSSRGRLVPELVHIPGLKFRELIINPWRLIYQINSRVEILAFLDSRRDLDEILFERLLEE